MFDGKEVLGMRLNWRKRYITLAPVATVIGLAFRLFDPDGLLGGEENIGITCALIPRDIDGIMIGDRHDPMGVPFQNGPIVGKDVFVPLDFIIGGKDGAGRVAHVDGLSAAGRSILLPSLSVAAAQMVAREVPMRRCANNLDFQSVASRALKSLWRGLVDIPILWMQHVK